MSQQINSYLIDVTVPSVELLIKSESGLTDDMVLDELRHDLVRRMIDGEIPFVYELKNIYTDSPKEKYDESKTYGDLPDGFDPLKFDNDRLL
ncbi:MAG: hypothetical protein CL887_04320 [Dehalococcoidia bacterium]|nr:hypothetical protein [Chloroflexota bacterium]MBR97704.1 hypothetical protein [Dehalococcoidia bacterium]|tara:strand:+ start:316 stop:591 length:276 start_codon:yes stop_codon:yes gene_type:complete